jgi:hypothetical protein
VVLQTPSLDPLPARLGLARQLRPRTTLCGGQGRGSRGEHERTHHAHPRWQRRRLAGGGERRGHHGRIRRGRRGRRRRRRAAVDSGSDCNEGCSSLCAWCCRRRSSCRLRAEWRGRGRSGGCRAPAGDDSQGWRGARRQWLAGCEAGSGAPERMRCTCCAHHLCSGLVWLWEQLEEGGAKGKLRL